MAYQSIHLGTKIDEGVTRALEMPSNDTGKGASQVGIEDADGNYIATNVEDALKESADIISTVSGELDSHAGNTSNPHFVTAGQTGAFPLASLDDLTSLTDFNTFTTVGVYHGILSVAVPNEPYAGGDARRLTVIVTSISGLLIQEVIYDDATWAGKKFRRIHVGSWKPWEIIYTSDCIPISTVAPSSALPEGAVHMVY